MVLALAGGCAKLVRDRRTPRHPADAAAPHTGPATGLCIFIPSYKIRTIKQVYTWYPQTSIHSHIATKYTQCLVLVLNAARSYSPISGSRSACVPGQRAYTKFLIRFETKLLKLHGARLRHITATYLHNVGRSVIHPYLHLNFNSCITCVHRESYCYDFATALWQQLARRVGSASLARVAGIFRAGVAAG